MVWRKGKIITLVAQSAYQFLLEILLFRGWVLGLTRMICWEIALTLKKQKTKTKKPTSPKALVPLECLSKENFKLEFKSDIQDGITALSTGKRRCFVLLRTERHEKCSSFYPYFNFLTLLKPLLTVQFVVQFKLPFQNLAISIQEKHFIHVTGEQFAC